MVVNSVIAEYLRANSDKYKLEDLKKEIIAKGYSSKDFDEVVELLALGKKGKSKTKSLPTPVVMKKKKKRHGFNWVAFILVLLAILIFGIMAMNYAGFDFFGFNIFNL